MFWKKINHSIRKLCNSTRIIGGYLANSVKKGNKNNGNKKNRTHKSPASRKSHMSSLLPGIMNH